MADRKISDLTALTTPASGDYLPIVDISEVAAASKNKRITIEELMRGAPDGTAAAPGIAFETDPNTGIYSPGADQLAVATNGVERVKFGTSEVVLNDGGADFDFRVEGDTKPNLFFVDAGDDRIQTDGPIGVGGANFGTASQVLSSNGSATPPAWQSTTAFALIDATGLLSLSNLMLLFAQRGTSIGIPGQPLFGVGPAVVSTTPVGIGPHDYYPIDLLSGSFM